MSEKRATHEHADKDGHFRRKDSVFRDFVSKDPDSKFPAEKGRYVLYMNYGCPWAHRSSIVRALKGLEGIIQMVPTDFDLTSEGWVFTGRNGSLDKDPIYGFTALKQLYLKANPEYEGRYTVPTLWDKKLETIVNNESSEIIRMFYSEFDDLLPFDDRETNKEGGGFYPEELRKEIDEMNDWVYNTVNNGVYKCGFATSQEAYDNNIYPLFLSLDRLESHLAPNNPVNRGGPFLFGSHVTEADIRLFTTLIRFDTAYHTIFQTNLKSIRHDYPNLNLWLRRLYWTPASSLTPASHSQNSSTTRSDSNTNAFQATTNFEAYRYGYARAKQRMTQKTSDGANIVVPRGPRVDIEPLEASEEVTRGLQGLSISSPIAAAAALAKPNGKAGPAVDAEAKASTNSMEQESAQQSNGSAASQRAQSHDRAEVKKRTAYSEENAKWVRAAKKAEKKSGGPNIHLAL